MALTVILVLGNLMLCVVWLDFPNAEDALGGRFTEGEESLLRVMARIYVVRWCLFTSVFSGGSWSED